MIQNVRNVCKNRSKEITYTHALPFKKLGFVAVNCL